jgi:predicted Ser/Thr protein kinase
MRTVGRYEVLHELGRGGMATVHLARQADLGRLVALKELEMLRATDLTVAQRFLREARMASSLSHPNIVTVYEYFEENGTPYIAMEYVDGGSLRPHMQQEPSLAQIGGVLEGLLAGLDYAGRQGIVHRDLKPENVLLTADGRVKIVDFGISKASDQVMTRASLTAHGSTIGTPAYMAPEQAMGRPVTPRTDLYSLGIIAFEMLVGRAPFAGTETPMGVLLRQVNDPVPSVASIREDVDPRLSDWVDGLLAKDPADRTPSAAVAADELDEILDGLLGNRWRRDAALPLLVAAEPLTHAFAATPATEPLVPTERWTEHTRPAAGAAALGAGAGMLAGAGIAGAGMNDRTLAPTPPMAAEAAAQAESPGRRIRPRTLFVAGFVLIAAVAAMAGTLGGGSGSATGTTPVAPATPAPAATPAPGTANTNNQNNTNNPNTPSSGSSSGDPGNSGNSGNSGSSGNSGGSSSSGSSSSAASNGGNGENADDGGDGGTSAANP